MHLVEKQRRANRICLIAVLGIAPFTLVAQSAAAGSPVTCSIRATTFDGWKAEEMANQWVQLIFVPELGGRLMQVTFDGHPYLFVNPEYAGKYIPPAEAAGQWINYGGDKIWPLPEGNDDEQQWTGASTPLDDGTYKFSVVSTHPRCTVRLDGPPDPPTGLQYSRDISIGNDSPEIDFHAIAKNFTGYTINWSVQSVSQYNLASPSKAGDYNHDFWAFTPVNPNSAYLLGYHVRDGFASDPSFSVKAGLFRLNWKYIENEVWVDSTAGWVAIVDGATNYAMVEKAQHIAGGEYPGKATVIFYKNGPTVELDAAGMPRLTRTDPATTPYYMEAELNSPMAELSPGQTYSMDTQWFPSRMGTDFQTVTDAGMVGRPLKVTRNGTDLGVTGQFGVFFAGRLVARLYDRGGAEMNRVTLRTASPRELVNLHQSIAAPADIVRVSVHLIDGNNVDRGALGEVFVSNADGAP